MTRQKVFLKDAAEIVGVKIKTAYEIYHTWPEKGVQILRHSATSRPQFYVDELYKMLESPK